MFDICVIQYLDMQLKKEKIIYIIEFMINKKKETKSEKYWWNI